MKERLLLSFACPMKWDDLTVIDGEVSRRQCDKCQCSVHNADLLSALEREALLEKSQTERVCIARSNETEKISLGELVKLYFRNRLAPISYLTKKQIAIAFSAFLLSGTLFSAPPVEARGTFSKDHTAYFLQNANALDVGQMRLPERCEILSSLLFKDLLTKRMLFVEPSIWQSSEALQFAKDYERGLISKGHVLAFANFLKDRGQVEAASAYFTLYLAFEKDSRGIGSNTKYALTLLHPKTEDLELIQKAQKAIGENRLLSMVQASTYPQDIKLLQAAAFCLDESNQRKDCYQFAFQKYLSQSSLFPFETRFELFGSLNELLNRTFDEKEQRAWSTELIKQVLKSIESKPSAYLIEKAYLKTLAPIYYKLLTCLDLQHDKSTRLTLARRISKVLPSFTNRAIQEQDSEALQIVADLYGRVLGELPAASKDPLPTKYRVADVKMEQLGTKAEARELGSGFATWGSYLYAPRLSVPAANERIETFLALAANNRKQGHPSESLLWLRAVDSLLLIGQNTYKLSNITRYRSEIEKLRPTVTPIEQEMLDYWTSFYRL